VKGGGRGLIRAGRDGGKHVSGRDLNPGPCEYKAGVLTTHSQRWSSYGMNNCCPRR
jgi:hypothetical protein